MIDRTPPDPDAREALPLEAFLRDVLPLAKLSLGELIDRENSRALPSRYARLLPETLLVLTLRPDVAEAIAPLAEEIERELTDSCTRHGSLYDRAYRVQLRRAADADAPLFLATAHAGQPAAAGASPPVEVAGAGGAAPAAPPDRGEPTPLPLADPDATRAEGVEPSAAWDAGRWLLVVEDEAGAEQEVFRVLEPFTTVGRRSDDPQLRVTVALSHVPHVSRRQLALLWDGEDPEPGFRVYNLGLNPIRAGERELSGARVGRGALRLDELEPVHWARVSLETPVRLGEKGPVLRLREAPPEPADPEATQYE